MDLIEAIKSRRAPLRRALRKWSSANFREFPWRTKGLSPYQVLIAESLLKRTTATAAARLYPDFLGQFPSVASLARARTEALVEAFAPIGLQHQRARTTHAMATHLIDQEGGEVPADIDRLLRVPGLGAYSARAVLSFAFGQPQAVLDSNVSRILRRLLADTSPQRPTDQQLQEVADALLPRAGHERHNYALLDLSAGICRYQRPLCTKCPLAHLCDSANLFIG